ncbi:hypothetical protein BDP27DRAFT_1451957 [Rhodocollybia butyracea]|uniref:Uncharacterized protein n=1 Tax=Rhodocollybia butyracea TaxID=206335 RepID=A0A9P5PH26_9AGAR|nr:hypothetical protein BDP27DRAFT_1451957 [Rhodocollybia butyracea]
MKPDMLASAGRARVLEPPIRGRTGRDRIVSKPTKAVPPREDGIIKKWLKRRCSPFLVEATRFGEEGTEAVDDLLIVSSPVDGQDKRRIGIELVDGVEVKEVEFWRWIIESNVSIGKVGASEGGLSEGVDGLRGYSIQIEGLDQYAMPPTAFSTYSSYSDVF